MTAWDAERGPCDGCGAEPLEPCHEGCTGFAGMLDELASQGAALIARAMTVEASKLYAVLHYRAELDAYRNARDLP